MAENKPIPEDPTSERSLVSCVFAGFRERDAIATRCLFELEPEAFVVPQSRSLWAAMRSLYAKGETLDPPLIHGELQRMGLASCLGGYTGVWEELSFNEFGNPEPLVRRLKELHDRRRLVEIAGKLDAKARDLVQEPAQIISGASTALMRINLGSDNVKRRSGVDLINRLAEGNPFRDQAHGAKLFYFPITSWNDAVECAPGHVIIVGASAKTGKTALAIDGMVHTAQQGIHTGLISLEMDKDEVEARLAGRLTKQNSRLFLKASWGRAVALPALENADMVSRLHWWCHPSGVPWARVEAEIREMVRLEGVKSVVIDYFTLVQKPTGSKSANDAALWGMLSTAIKRLAQELGICIILLCQLNREGAEGEPHKYHLRETGQLEQDGNAIVFLWKDKEDGPVFGKVSDNRSGPVVGKRELLFDGATCTFDTGERFTNSQPDVQGWS